MIKTRQEQDIQIDLLRGNINRMCVTDNMNELEDMLLFAEMRIKQIYFYNKRRIEDEN